MNHVENRTSRRVSRVRAFAEVRTKQPRQRGRWPSHVVAVGLHLTGSRAPQPGRDHATFLGSPCAMRAGCLTGLRLARHSRPVAAKSATGFDSPIYEAHKAPPTEARRFFHARVSSGRCTFPASTADGAREPQGSPVLVQVFQPRAVRHPVWNRVGGLLNTRSTHHETFHRCRACGQFPAFP